ncbi:major facilitator superfamily transporter MFS_1 [Thecamonas trahens ATCC 50062]|uniref:Major facilitator superfamily transporter MFS_1 n=1 Tax=Thecamonas trahens ATCC 50062 TaxID=461836 RepID=A0A0L0D5Q6_THETB|nr:major facilitator superfamily transporter MFS_1 [Thecamonas trahens ATCC 50062]KNC47540.1 major facilitator superfamily transporter MFS_1 [Thecamonas trahens ATCC 50062]|eukprot:XP_013759472.1 major facilitator superfamily transporter MFS_1 [Thecamonas trahens ATCC 50062]
MGSGRGAGAGGAAGGGTGNGAGLYFDLPSSEKTTRQRFFGRRMVFFFLTVVNLLTYYDRGVIAALLLDIENHFDLDSTRGGLLGSVFMVGFMLASLIFAKYVHTVRPTYLLCIGLLIWCGATAYSGLAPSYVQLVIARSLTGVGEASFCGISPTMIDDIAPPKQRTVWLSIFFAAIPIGAGLGYIGSGVITRQAGLSWRWVFLTESMAMLPFALGILLLPYTSTSKDKSIRVAAPDVDPTIVSPFEGSLNPSDDSASAGAAAERAPLLAGAAQTRTGSLGNRSAAAAHSAESAADAESTFAQDFWTVLTNPVYGCICLAYAAYTFVFGGLAYWAPTFVQKRFDMSLDDATFGLGTITVGCGLVGTAAGGIIVDAVAKRRGGVKGMAGAALQIKFTLIYALLAVPPLFFAFWVNTAKMFFGLLVIAELLLFAITGPINGALLSAVSEYYRTLAMSMSIMCIHLLGDMPSPVIIGAVISATGSYRTSMLLLVAWYVWCLLFLAIALTLAHAALRKLLRKALLSRPTGA